MSDRWEVLVQKSLRQRVPLDKFESFVELLQKDVPIESYQLCLYVLKRVRPAEDGIDPLIAIYSEGLLSNDLVHSHDVLQALLDYRQSSQPADDHDAFAGAASSIVTTASLDQSLLMSLARKFSTDSLKPESIDGKKLFASLTAWMTSLVAQNSDMMVQNAVASSHEAMHAIMITRESFATVMVTCLLNPHVGEELRSGLPQEIATPLAESFASFVTLMTATNMQLASRLQMIQKDHPPLQINESIKPLMNVDGDQSLGRLHLESIVDTDPVNTRASFAIYLDGLLDKCPHASDAALLGFIQNRYKGDNATGIVDFILACFDLLGLSISRGDSPERCFVQHSFLTNKAPTIAAFLSSASFVPVDGEFLISQALARLDPSMFGSFSDGTFLEGQGNLLADARRHFVLACVNIGIFGPDGAERLLGEQIPADTQLEGRVQKQNLLEECRNDTQKLHQLIEKFDVHDGNTPTRVEVIAEIFHETCTSRDKVALKNLCNQISRNPLTLDAIALYTDIRSFSQPMCFLLAEWKHDEDEGEHQPIYDEFSACVLLLLAMSYRFNLSAAELGFPADSTFWQLLLSGGIVASSIKELNEDQNRHLSGWVKGLFDSNSLEDDLLSSCAPQDFYSLVPSLFQQATMACKFSAIDEEHLKNGLELLLESFLIPALVPAFIYMLSSARENDDKNDVLLTILARIVNPQSLNGDAAHMHKTVLSILADRLIHFLENFKARQAKNEAAVQQLIDKLQGDSGYCRGADATIAQLRSWTTGSANGILETLRNTIGALCFWTTNTGLQATLPTYSHLLVRAAVRIKGAEAILHAIVEETNAQITAGLGDAALDIVTAIIVSNAMASSNAISAHLSLRDALQLDVVDAPRVFSTKNANRTHTETSVRLSRRVETLIANVAATAEQQHQQTIQMPLPDAMMADIGLDAAAAAAAVGLGPSNQVGEPNDASTSNPLDFASGGAGGLQLNLDVVLPDQIQQAQDVHGMTSEQRQASDTQMPPPSPDDIFADLQTDFEF